MKIRGMMLSRAMVLAALLACSLASPALAQAGTDDCQYVDQNGACVPAEVAVEVDPGAFVDPVVKGTDALTGALSGEPAPRDASSNTSTSRPDIEVLPDTGGVSILVPAGGALLVMAGLTARRALR